MGTYANGMADIYYFVNESKNSWKQGLRVGILVQIYQAGMVIGQHHQEKALMDIEKHI